MLRAVAILALVVATTTTSRPPPPAPTETSHRAEQGAHESGGNPNGKSNSANPFAGSRVVSHATNCPHCEGSANNSSASSQWWFNFLLVVFTGLLALFALLQLRAMNRQLGEMKTTNTDTHDLAQAAKDGATAMLGQLEAYERPWVTASIEAQTPIQFGIGGAMYVGFNVWLENIGHSIATDISFDIEIVPVDLIPTDYSDVISTQDRMAKSLKPEASGPVLFAGEKVPVFRRLNIVETQKHAVTFEGDRYLSLCLAVVIKYVYPTSERPHTTRIGFIFGNNKEPLEGWLLIKLGEELPREKVTILRVASGGGAD